MMVDARPVGGDDGDEVQEGSKSGDGDDGDEVEEGSKSGRTGVTGMR
jgi:hypothetical protein